MIVDTTRNTDWNVLQNKLHQAASTNKKRRFHSLIDKVYDLSNLTRAWKHVSSDRHSKSKDYREIKRIKDKGLEQFLFKIQEELKNGCYSPAPVRRIYIPKDNGDLRPLGIPTIKDRVVQTAVKLIIEPIFEADFLDFSYGFRPDRSAHDALREISKIVNQRNHHVVEVDIKSYFDNIPHDLLVKLMRKRIADERIILLVEGWLKAGVVEKGKISYADAGTPQGGAISPLLANIYLNELDQWWRREHLRKGKMIRYADDFIVITDTAQNAREIHDLIVRKLAALKLKCSADKTRVVNLNLRDGSFDFLGFTHFCRPNKQGKLVCIRVPRRKKIDCLLSEVSSIAGGAGPDTTSTADAKQYLDKCQAVVSQWWNYFKISTGASKNPTIIRTQHDLIRIIGAGLVERFGFDEATAVSAIHGHGRIELK
ncbi:group II intron reverse transcriptase/maturase [Brevibacillus fulvus]|uniref:Group II intron reverse transcriptase/maturase n=1 Tax=Brevibacillus fulvus TaxID=1125967 RepID=A0A938XXS1_9BACL|nr:group II intron reverse transcriptase/maturase [Brevibacillus fulvus]